MSARERARQSPLSGLFAFVLLAGLLAMHGLATDHASCLVRSASGPPGGSAHLHPSMSGDGKQKVTMSSLVTKNTPATERNSIAASDSLVATSDSAGAGHRMLDLCVAVLSLVLWFLARAHAKAQTSHHRDRLQSLLRALSRAPPTHLCPSLTGLCVARV
jgi:hypothetical protein